MRLGNACIDEIILDGIGVGTFNDFEKVKIFNPVETVGSYNTLGEIPTVISSEITYKFGLRETLYYGILFIVTV